jgi:catechol 2,3-dioxygenase-like lactoylglutathione lyase family enzyme
MHLICKDLKKMTSFFTDIIGAKLVEERKFGTADGVVMDLAGNTINLRVARQDEALVDPGKRSVYGYDHIGLEVDDLDAVYGDLTARGYRFTVAPMEIPGLKIAFFKGPEDITIELVQKLA